MSQESPESLQQQNQTTHSERDDMYLLVELLISTKQYITFPLYEGCFIFDMRVCLTFDVEQGMSAFIITKLSHRRDGTQEQLLAMHLRGDTSTRRGRNRTCGSNRYVRACTHRRKRTRSQTHTHARARTYRHGHLLIPS